MDLDDKEPTVVRALALALMRQAADYLVAVKEDEACDHLRMAIDMLRSPKPRGRAAPAA